MRHLRKALGSLALGVIAVGFMAAPAWTDGTGTWVTTKFTSSYHCSASRPGPKVSTWYQSCVVVNGPYWQSATIATVTGVGLSYSVAAGSVEFVPGAGGIRYACAATRITSARSKTCFGPTRYNARSTVSAAGDITVNGVLGSVSLLSPDVYTGGDPCARTSCSATARTPHSAPASPAS